MWYCLKCQAGDLRQTGKWCYVCGEKLVEVAANDCKCGIKSPNNYAFCMKCGKKLIKKEVEVDNEKQVACNSK
jgi:predicted amidophosphoribosyltransferase